MCGNFLKKRRAQRLGVYCGIMKKKKKGGNDKSVILNIAQRNTEQTEIEQISIEKMTFNKNTRSKRHSNYSVFVKSRVAARGGLMGSGGWILAPA